MDTYRYQQIAYLIVPVMLGIEFFLAAREEKGKQGETPLGFYVLEFFGFIFTALIPAIFVFTIWAVEAKAFPMQPVPLARLDRYGVLFFFMGAWWQVYLITALRARRNRDGEGRSMTLWGPFLVLGIFISLLVLWVSPWNLKWISIGWFALVFGVFTIAKAGPKAIERTMWVLAAITFIFENALFLWFESVV